MQLRPRYLLVVEDGPFGSLVELGRFHRWLDAWLEWGAPRRVLFDARAVKEQPPELASVRDARWSWSMRDDRVHKVALVVSTEASVARVNMRAIAERANVRAFIDPAVAHRWLCAKTRTFPGVESAQTTRLRAVRTIEDE